MLVSWLLLLAAVSWTYAYKPLSTQSLSSIADSKHRALELADPLMIPRVSGTPGNQQVRDIIVQHFRNLGWHVALDEFVSATPIGDTSFANIIATQNPDAQRRLVLAAHYDSKATPEGFIGATDSAVPCGMLMDIAESLPFKTQKLDNTTLQLVFFDGEEAFVHWNEYDSIYGAKHLGQVWAESGDLERMDVMVLLDLMGAPNPTFPNYYPSTDWLFRNLVNIEKRLYKTTNIFDLSSSLTYRGYVMQDDHLPFLHRGADILHLIPYPFPKVWHTIDDNAEAIDPNTVEQLTIIMKAFVAEYLEIVLPTLHTEL
ncbi:hypothetical protein K492DRAFT_143235 [Lichtheimia hyalospora FSU 10163]|nr:hypothetical protein K492DRAFT_143235 [Lichtheimia hyalospora FSU 10163]